MAESDAVSSVIIAATQSVAKVFVIGSVGFAASKCKFSFGYDPIHGEPLQKVDGETTIVGEWQPGSIRCEFSVFI